MFDNTLLGMRAFEAMRGAVLSGAISPAAIIIPRRAAVHAMLLELRLSDVSGFDVSAMNAYRWHPIAESLDLNQEPHRPLSRPFACCDIDFQRWLEMHAAEDAGDMRVDAEMEVQITDGGLWNAIAVWFELDIGGVNVSSLASRSWMPSVYFIGERPVNAGETVRVRVHHDNAQFVFQSVPAQARPHHALVPLWHFDMLNDTTRNDAYERAIRRAVDRRKASHGEVRDFVREMDRPGSHVQCLAIRSWYST